MFHLSNLICQISFIHLEQVREEFPEFLGVVVQSGTLDAEQRKSTKRQDSTPSHALSEVSLQEALQSAFDSRPYFILGTLLFSHSSSTMIGQFQVARCEECRQGTTQEHPQCFHKAFSLDPCFSHRKKCDLAA